MVYEICRYIQDNDRNSDIMDVWEEYQDGVLEPDTVIMILQNVLDMWKEDITLFGMSAQERKYYDFLGLI